MFLLLFPCLLLREQQSVEGVAVDAVALGYLCLADASVQQRADRVQFVHHPAYFRAHPAGPPEPHPGGFLGGEGLPGALRDEIALDFGGEAEGEGNYLGIDVVGEFEVVLDGVDVDAAPAAEVEY